MRRLQASIAIASCAIALSGAANAAQRTFVASYGLDTNPCSVTQPCRSFAVAITQTAAAGEVVVLDSAGYGPVTIGQSVSIIAPPGVYAGISVPAAQNGVTISAGPSDHVVLRGLTINGQGGVHGIRVVTAQVVHVESCTVSNMAQDGIRIEGGTVVHIANAIVRDNAVYSVHTLVGAGELYVRDSRVSGGSSGVYLEGGTFDGSGLTIEEAVSVGMFVAPNAATTVKAALADSLLAGNGYGYVAYSPVAGATVRASATRVTASRNASAGFESNNLGGGGVILTVTDSSSVGNGSYGVTAISGGTTNLVRSTSSGNASFDLYQTGGGILRTSGTNSLTGRGAADVSGVLTSNPPQ